MPSPQSIERAIEAAERLPIEPGDPDRFYADLAALLARHGLPWVGACWHLTDPSTGLFVWTGQAGELPGDFVSALENEYLEDDLAKYSDLAGRRAPVASLVAEAGGDPERSARYRTQLAPDGVADELRISFADAFGRWGSMGLFSERPFDPAAVERAARLVPAVARMLRQAMVAAAAAAGDGPPGVLMLDASDRVVTRDSRAGELLEGCARTSELPGAIHVLAARARMEDAPVRGRTLTTDGGWLAVDASPLEESAGGVAVVLRQASAPSLIDLKLRAAGLTDREREIARAVLRGDDTATIAATLHLSPWTVQDHLKSVWDKTGVRSRRAFVAKWAFASTGIEG